MIFSSQTSNKDKVTKSSSAIHHCREFTGIICTSFGDSCGHASKPFLVVSYGDPDHRSTFGSVKIADICLFRALYIDMLVNVRTCPYEFS